MLLVRCNPFPPSATVVEFIRRSDSYHSRTLVLLTPELSAPRSSSCCSSSPASLSCRASPRESISRMVWYLRRAERCSVGAGGTGGLGGSAARTLSTRRARSSPSRSAASAAARRRTPDRRRTAARRRSRSPRASTCARAARRSKILCVQANARNLPSWRANARNLAAGANARNFRAVQIHTTYPCHFRFACMCKLQRIPDSAAKTNTVYCVSKIKMGPVFARPRPRRPGAARGSRHSTLVTRCHSS